MWNTIGIIFLWIFAIIGAIASLLWVYAWWTEEEEEKPKRTKQTNNNHSKKTKNK